MHNTVAFFKPREPTVQFPRSIGHFSPMIIPKPQRRAIFEFLFREGVLCAPSSIALSENPVLAKDRLTKVPVTNLQVIHLMKSFVSRKYCTRQFAWQHHYWFLTNEGVVFLRAQLGADESVVPRTWKQSKAASHSLLPSNTRPQGRFQRESRETRS